MPNMENVKKKIVLFIILKKFVVTNHVMYNCAVRSIRDIVGIFGASTHAEMKNHVDFNTAKITLTLMERKMKLLNKSMMSF